MLRDPPCVKQRWTPSAQRYIPETINNLCKALPSYVGREKRSLWIIPSIKSFLLSI